MRHPPLGLLSLLLGAGGLSLCHCGLMLMIGGLSFHICFAAQGTLLKQLLSVRCW